jgi:hypothetical protein
MNLKHALHNHSSASKQQQQHTMTSTTSTKLFDQALIAAEKAATRRFTTAKLSVPEELDWYTNNTDWDALDRKEFRDIMIRMETITVQYYEDFGTGTYPSRSAAIKRFWAEEWGCEYLPESGKWLDLTTNTIIKSETEKQAEKAQKKALKKQEKEALKKEEKKNKKALKQQLQQQQQDAQFDEEEEAYAEAYAQARLAEEAAWQEAEQARAQKELAEAQAYLDSFDYTSEEEEEEEEEVQPPTQVPCQGVLYIEELTNTKGDPDWRAFIYYDARIRRYVLKGTRRSLRATGKKTVYPEVTLCFRSSRELARYLCSSTDSLLNVTMYAMSCGALAGSTFGELYTQPLRGYKTELFGYDSTRPRYSTFVDYLSMVRDLDAGHSTFASF